MSVTSRPPSPPSPMRVGNYELLSHLGEGGMGVVHLARALDGRRVALKVIRPNVVGDDESRARLAREVNSLSRVRSHRVAEVIDADPWGPVPYVATRYVPGYSLHDQVAKKGPLEGEDLVWTARCLAEALVAVHAAGVLHRDVKPSNVLMEGRTPVLIDFGLARVAEDARLTAHGWLLGTPGYLAPEILHGEDATPAADVHSWAATVAYAGLGRGPFGSGPSVAVMDRVRRGEHDLTGLEGDLRDVVEAALDPEPRNRPTLAAVLTWLDPDDSPTTFVEHRPFPAPAEDPTAFVVVPETRPLDASLPAPTTGAGGVGDELPTQWVPPATLVEPIPYGEEGGGPGHPYAHQYAQPYAQPSTQSYGQPHEQAAFGAQRSEGSGQADRFRDPWGEDAAVQPLTPVRVSWAERLRRTALMFGLVLLVTALVSAAPYVSAALLGVIAWMLRSGSLASSASEQRRALRGRKWYDGTWTLLATPYYVLASVPGTIALLLWAAGLATVTALICFALVTPVPQALAAVGATAAVGLWAGPGAERVRRPVRRAVDGASARGWTWALCAALLALGVWAAGSQVFDSGTETGIVWAPWDAAPSFWR